MLMIALTIATPVTVIPVVFDTTMNRLFGAPAVKTTKRKPPRPAPGIRTEPNKDAANQPYHAQQPSNETGQLLALGWGQGRAERQPAV